MTVIDSNCYICAFYCCFYDSQRTYQTTKMLMNNQCKTITEVEQVGGIHILHYFVGIDFTPLKPRVMLMDI